MVKTQNRFRKLENLRFGRLTVLERDWSKTTKSGRWKVYWKCRCDCGTIKSIRAEHLKPDDGKFHTRSCGCLQKEIARKNGKLNKLPDGEYAIRSLYYHYKKQSGERNLIFNLSRESFEKLIKNPCFYCGNIHSNTKRCRSGDILNYNGIDRISSDYGYEPTNVVSCCIQCNYSKKDYSINEFYDWVDRIYNNLKSKNLIK